MDKSWETYEEVAAYLLNQFKDELGLFSVEGKQKVDGVLSGTEFKIDAKGVREGNGGFIIVECRQYTSSKQSQEKIGGLAWRIIDTGAEGGIIVSPLGLQKGAKKIAAITNIMDVHLTANSTPSEFLMQFLNKLMLGTTDNIVLSDEIVIERVRRCKKCKAEFKVEDNETFCKNCR